ncbi:MAG: phosphoglycerate kinase [SAR324 cluster bacterium]|nr:phosphoglycerate kinase [SAR324 cluster bacterium]MBL7036079.1 phosphoglycerate kinase [SAR324 cluster bacterium]
MSMHEKQFIEDLQLKDQRVLTRVDFNVPLNENQEITDNGRIAAALPTIRYIIEQGGKAVLMSHLGRPGGERVEKLSLQPAADELSRLLGQTVTLAPDCLGEQVELLVNDLQNGDVVLLENLRFHAEETKNEANFCAALARLGDVFINDAFGTAHRAHASTAGVAEYIPVSAVGYLIRKELQFLGAAVSKPAKPFTAILGGAKVSDKIKVIDKLLDKVQTLIIGGGMSCTFLKAQGFKIGASLLDEESLEFAAELLQKARKKSVELLLPIDAVIADKFDKNAETRLVSVEEGAPDGWLILDIGPRSSELFCNSVLASGTVLWNGPMGVFEMEAFAEGTLAIAQSMAEATDKGAVTIIGGGDSAAAIQQFELSQRITHVSTGGGASLEFLEGKELPGVSVIQQTTTRQN